MTAENRKEFLRNVEHIVCKDRNTSYGEPEDSFTKIADYWANYLGIEVSAIDVGILLSLMKIARLSNNKEHLNSIIDLAGYAGCVGGMILDKKEGKPQPTGFFGKKMDNGIGALNIPTTEKIQSMSELIKGAGFVSQEDYVPKPIQD